MIPPSPETLKESLEQHLPDALRFLRELVEINSFTTNRAGVNANAARIIWQFSRFGFTDKSLQCEEEGAGSHLILDSSKGNDDNRPVIACISHLDTVFTPEEEERNQFTWQEKGNRIYGPGTYDIKGGTALLWLMFATMQEQAPELLARYRWVLLWNAAEEHLAEDFAQSCFAYLPEKIRCALVFEGDNRRGDDPASFAILNGRKGHAKFHLETFGRGAHSGGGHSTGASAIRQIAQTIEMMESLTDYDRGISVNVGSISGGSVYNRVPHHAEAVLEMRAHDLNHFALTRDTLLALSGEGGVHAHSDAYPCRVKVTKLSEIAPWPGGAETERLVACWKAGAQRAGYQLAAEQRGGLSDGNYFAARFPVLDGLGPRGGNPHASERAEDASKLPEYIDASSLVPKALINLLGLATLAEEEADK